MISHDFRRKFFIIFVTSAALLVIGEISVRLFSPSGYFTPDIERQRRIPMNPSLFSRYIFPDNYSFSNGTTNHWNLNNMGYRGENFLPTKSDSVLRIIVYGGSAVFRGQKDWPRRVENFLKESGIKNVEIIDACAPGHSSLDSFGKLFSEGHLFRPDYIIFYHAWNDIKYFGIERSILRELKQSPALSNPLWNYQGTLDRRLSESSQLYVRLRQRYYQWQQSSGIEVPELNGKIGVIGPGQFKLNLEMFVDLSRNIGAVPILMTQARLVTQNNSREVKTRIRFDLQGKNHETICRGFQIADEIILNVSKSKNVELIDASQSITGKENLFKDHVHLTEEGADSLATVTARHLKIIINNNGKKL